MKRYKRIGPFVAEDIWFDTKAFRDSKESVVCLHTNELLPVNAYDAVSREQTLLLDISVSMEDIFNGFEYKSCKYPIRKAQRDGVQVKKAENESEYKQYLDFENAFCQKRRIPILSMDELKQLDVFYALSQNGEYLGGCAFVLAEQESVVRYKYGATLHKMNANEAILWKAIEYYHYKGFKEFDFGGVIPTDDKNSYYYRHYQFKKKFGGTLTDTYNYYRFKGIIKVLYAIFDILVRRFFDGKLNEAINWLNRRGLIQ